MKVLKITIIIALIVLAWLTLSSFLFLSFAKLDGTNATPLTGFQYFMAYRDDRATMKILTLSHLIPAVVLFTLAFMVVMPKKKKLHGDARMATRTEIKKAGMFETDGVLVGKLGKQALYMAGHYHLLLAAPTRGGKGVSIVVPVCLTYPDSMIVLDTKVENFGITSGFRKENGQDVFCFNPAPSNYKTHRWNPLGYISEDKNLRIDDVQKISNFLIPTPHTGDPMWSSEARKLFEGIVLMLIDLKEHPVTLGEVYRQVHTKEETSDYLKSMLEENEGVLSPLTQMAFTGFIETASKTRSGILASLKTALNIFANPLIDSATSTNDFDLREIRRKRTTIYISITIDNLIRLAPIINLFFQQVIDLNTRTLPEQDKTLKHNVLLLMDEFTAIGRIPVLAKGVGMIAGYGIQLMPIIQSPTQLKATYKEDADTFLENMHLRIIFRPINMKVATEIANELGNVTIKQKSRSKKRSGWDSGNETVSDQKRQLLLPQEIRDMKDDKAILLHWKLKPIDADRFFYYDEQQFKDRLLDPIEIPEIHVKEHEQRGGEKVEIEINEVLENITVDLNSNTVLSDEQIEVAANDFLNYITATS